MKRYIQFEPQDTPEDLGDFELQALIREIAIRASGEAIGNIILENIPEDRTQLLQMADDLLGLDRLQDNGAILIGLHDAEAVEEFEDVPASGVGESDQYFMGTVGRSFGPQPGDFAFGEFIPKIVEVDSSTRPGLVHQVTMFAGIPIKCSCEGFTHHGRCKHIANVRSERTVNG
jgi:hypothetical protein